jgi:hypothetical protein
VGGVGVLEGEESALAAVEHGRGPLGSVQSIRRVPDDDVTLAGDGCGEGSPDTNGW